MAIVNLRKREPVLNSIEFALPYAVGIHVIRRSQPVFMTLTTAAGSLSDQLIQLEDRHQYGQHDNQNHDAHADNHGGFEQAQQNRDQAI